MTDRRQIVGDLDEEGDHVKDGVERAAREDEAAAAAEARNLRVVDRPAKLISGRGKIVLTI